MSLLSLCAGLLAACSGQAGDGDTAGLQPDPAPQPVVSAPGQGLADAIGARLDAAGGRIDVAGAAVEAPAGAFVAAQLSLQPIVNTLDESGGPSVAVTSDGAWQLPLTVTVPLGAADETARNLGLAVQQADGSWRDLERVSVDLAAGTLSASLPLETEATPSGTSADAPVVKRLAVYRAHFMVPLVATLAPGESATFTPFAALPEGMPEGCAVLRPASCWRPVVEPHVLRNRELGQVHDWVVDAVREGSAALGRLRDSDPVGGVYTAPAARPAEGRVLLQMRIHPMAPNVMFLPWGPLAVVRLVDAPAQAAN